MHKGLGFFPEGGGLILLAFVAFVFGLSDGSEVKTKKKVNNSSGTVGKAMYSYLKTACTYWN